MQKEEELYFSALNNEVENVKKLIAEGVNLDFKQVNGFTPLIVAITRKNFEVAQLLIEKGANVNICNGYNSALKFAILNKNINLAIKLIEHGALRNENIISMLDNISEDEKRKILDAFEKQESKKTDSNSQNTNNVDAITEDNSINMQDENGNTKLIIASQQNNKELILKLINDGADLNIENNEQKTALFYVLQNKEYEFIKELIDAGATLNANSKQVLYALPINIQNPIKNMFIEKRQRDLQKRLDEINSFINLLENQEDTGEENNN